jgi:hypothetical protein
MRVLSVILLSLLLSPARGDEVSANKYSEKAKARLAAVTSNNPEAKVLHSITNLPAAIRARLTGTADAGEAFSSGCIRAYAGSRFLTASKVGNIYLVAIERGGIFYDWCVVGFVVNDAGKVTLEQWIEPASAANRGQPVTPGTNRPPTAAGPGR